MATIRYRVGGSGFTVFKWQNKVIASARQISHTSPAPVGPGAVPIHPLDASRPVEIITPAAISMGQLTLELYELYGQTVWASLAQMAGNNDLADIFKAVADQGNDITVQKYIFPPAGVSGFDGNVGLKATPASGGTGNGAPTQTKSYYEQYNGCVITNVMDGETIEIGTMEVLKQITVAYRYITKHGYTDIPS